MNTPTQMPPPAMPVQLPNVPGQLSNAPIGLSRIVNSLKPKVKKKIAPPDNEKTEIPGAPDEKEPMK